MVACLFDGNPAMPEDDARIILHYLTNRIDIVGPFNHITGGFEDESVVYCLTAVPQEIFEVLCTWDIDGDPDIEPDPYDEPDGDDEESLQTP